MCTQIFGFARVLWVLAGGFGVAAVLVRFFGAECEFFWCKSLARTNAGLVDQAAGVGEDGYRNSEISR